ncbi:two-component sensor histidine kinase [Methylomonas sp. LL1]|uniref:sensor histidine kinase n=1 Tax=Methylomonas sp. LL1 TaxID=2785785 RepID=UPI0018C4053B|nr:ATP-binding protein [Methylomonas sp. LL1]QPK64294.1 two-component sensor histidine kinase [Methylomonas sp. LL1]
MSTEPFNDFERELALDDLLRGIDGRRLLSALQGLLNAPLAIFDTKGVRLLGETEVTREAPCLPIIVELEAIGSLNADVAPQHLQAAAELLTLLLRTNARYLMASDLHLQTQRADYEELQRRHLALAKSEQRYKALSETLEQRVEQQVKTIESAQLKLYESEKLASVGRLAAGIAHEINNPIGFIRSNLTTAVGYLESLKKIGVLFEASANTAALRAAWQAEDMAFVQQDMQDILNESIQGTERIAAIVKDLKGFSRINDSARESADLNQIIRQICNIAIAELRDKVKLSLDLAVLPPFYCQPGELGQAFLNLLINSVDSINTTGMIQFRTYSKDQRIHIEVRDNGCGIAETDLPHVFDPFFSTKEVGKGMGLGLTVCRNIIQAHGGNLAIKSKPNVGTLVSIVLPLKPVRQASS